MYTDQTPFKFATCRVIVPFFDESRSTAIATGYNSAILTANENVCGGKLELGKIDEISNRAERYCPSDWEGLAIDPDQKAN